MSSLSSLPSACTKKSTIFNLLTKKKSLYLDDLREAIPIPTRSPNAQQYGTGGPWPDLPRWHRLPLEQKMPALPGHEADRVLARRKLGETLRLQVAEEKNFDTTDPCDYEAKLDYEGMHDPHLRRFFRENGQVRELVVKAGLVTPELDVKCSLREYNTYRNYLRIMHGKMVKKELEKMDELHREKMLLETAERQAQKKLEELKKDEIRMNLLHELRLRDEKHLQNLRDKWQRNKKRLRSLRQAKRQALREKKDEVESRIDVFKRKRMSMALREQQRVLNTLKEWNERDSTLDRTLRTNAARWREQRTSAVINRFERKRECQEQWMQREALMQECAEKFKKSFLDCYRRKIEESQRKLQELFVAKRKALERELKKKARRRTKKTRGCRCPVLSVS